MLKRERRALLREREQLVRDLGGIVYEMYRLDRFRVELVTERCQALVALDDRIEELESLLARATGRGPRCECGAPIAWGAHFCQNCGRPAGPRPVVACARCGAPLPADVGFCGRCGSPVEADASGGVPEDTEPDGEPIQAVQAGDGREA
ncbi:MAG TPA: zinc ribbon domain-containing protein [Gaiellaceae bacterium]|nr:zinc ribbon domain-containing protein [Gaiellaceae bacterium]